MKIHQINVIHAAPKDRHESIELYAVADCEEQIYELLNEKVFGKWSDKNEEDGLLKIYDDDYNVTGMETYKQRVMRLRGDINDPDTDYSDAYYGVTLYGWDEGKDITQEELD